MRYRQVLAEGALAMMSVLPLAASAQDDAAPVAMTTEAALAALPDPERYALVIRNDGLKPEAVEAISAMVVDAIGNTHFFGAIQAFVPEGSTEFSIHVRSGLHSIEAAEAGARALCEAERAAGDSPCYPIGQILPEGGQDAPSLSHDAIYAFAQSAPQMEGPKVVARSRATAAWAMWSGKDVRQSALDECDAAVEAQGLAPDCEIVVDDAS